MALSRGSAGGESSADGDGTTDGAGAGVLSASDDMIAMVVWFDDVSEERGC